MEGEVPVGSHLVDVGARFLVGVEGAGLRVEG